MSTSTFADPFLACEQCGKRAVSSTDGANSPCGHKAGVDGKCPSWSPVDGCRCQLHLGYVPHPAVLP